MHVCCVAGEDVGNKRDAQRALSPRPAAAKKGRFFFFFDLNKQDRFFIRYVVKGRSVATLRTAGAKEEGKKKGNGDNCACRSVWLQSPRCAHAALELLVMI